MNFKKVMLLAGVAAAFLVAISAPAKTRHADDVLIGQDAAVAGSHLASGTYDIEWQTHSPEATVKFYEGNKLVATAEGRAVDKGKKYSANEVVYDQTADGKRVIREIHFIGSSQILVFDK